MSQLISPIDPNFCLDNIYNQSIDDICTHCSIPTLKTLLHAYFWKTSIQQSIYPEIYPNNQFGWLQEEELPASGHLSSLCQRPEIHSHCGWQPIVLILQTRPFHPRSEESFLSPPVRYQEQCSLPEVV